MHGGTLLLFSSPLATSNDKILPFKQTRQICVVLGTNVNANSKFLSYFCKFENQLLVLFSVLTILSLVLYKIDLLHVVFTLLIDLSELINKMYNIQNM